MKLLGIARTKEQLFDIKEGHVTAGHYPGRKHALPQGMIKVNLIGGIPHPHIKKGKFFTKLARVIWKETNGTIPPRMMVHFKDLNTMNLDPANLTLIKVGQLTFDDRMKLLRIAKINIETLNKPILKKPELPGRADVSDHSKKIKVVINSRLTIYVAPGTDIAAIKAKYEPKPLLPAENMQEKLGYTYQF